jgi:hypothetical protein
MKEKYTNFTMAELKNMLDDKVNSYNAAKTQSERLDLKVELAEIAEACNELSLLTVYANCMEDEKPVVKFASTFYYDTVSPKYTVQKGVDNGKTKTFEVCAVQEGEKKMSLFKFIEWAKNRNQTITADKNWVSKVADARNTINAEWKKFMASEDGEKISKTAVKTAMQNAFDALAFIEAAGGSGKNAIIANKDVANYVIALAASVKVTSKDKKPDFKLTFLGKNWEGILFDVLHMAVEGKTYEVSYDAVNAEAEDEAEPVAEEPKAEPKKTGKGKGKKSK